MQISKFKLDQKQEIVSYKLTQIHNRFEKFSFGKIFRKIVFMQPKPIRGLYIYGDVGRGKSMLMKEFYHSLRKTPKLYCHFNSFMKVIHEAFRDVRKKKKKGEDQLIEAINLVLNSKSQYFQKFIEEEEDDDAFNTNKKSKKIFNKKIKILCLDEFQVIDAADSMILSRILTYLYEQNIVIIYTSNCHPQDLYKSGIQAELFQDFVKDTLLINSPAVKLESDSDYREIKSYNSSNQRFFVSKRNYDDNLNQIIKQLTNGKTPYTTKITVWGREIVVKQSYAIDNKDKNFLSENKSKKSKNNHNGSNGNGKKTNKMAIFTFDELCRNSFSAADYQAICQNFDLIFLLKVPQLKPEDTNEARRLTLFIDEIYENKNPLIILSEVEAKDIFPKGIGSRSFLRTVSRLKEIQSDEYWRNSKLDIQ